MKVGGYSSSTISAQRFLKEHTDKIKKSIAQLSSGKAVTAAQDSPSTNALVQELAKSQTSARVEIESISQTQSSIQIQSGQSTLNLARLQDLRALVVQASSDTLDSSSRQVLQTHVNASSDLIQIDVSSSAAASSSIEAIDARIQQESQQLGEMSASYSALSYRSNANSIALENMTAARSNAEDVDIAGAVSDVQKAKMLSSVAAAAITQTLQSSARMTDLLKRKL
jgi:flagellin